MSNCIAILTLIVSVIAVVVSLCISRKSSQDAQKQINAIHELLDVFVAVQNLNIFETQQKYKKQLEEVDREIEQINNVLPERNFFDINSHIHAQRQKEKELLAKRKKLEHNLSSIDNYIKKTTK